MRAERVTPAERRVLVLPPTLRDAEVTGAFLERAHIPHRLCADPRELADEIEAGVGTVVLTDAAFTCPAMGSVFATLARQPAWSDVPVVLLGGQPMGEGGALPAGFPLANVTLLARPCAPGTLIGAVLAGLRARWRQYEIRDQIETLRRAEEILRTDDQRKDEFLAILSHELRNPLAPLTNALKLLARSASLVPADRRVLEIAERQRRQLSRLIDDLLEVSRISQGRIALRPEPLDVGTAVAHAVESIRADSQARGHTLSVHLPAAPVQVHADPARVAQILENLLNNACKYTPDGGSIRAEVDTDGDAVAIRIVDDGIGIEPAKQARLFEMFHQIDPTLDRSQGGLGIGLALVRRLVEMHGGAVTVHSEGAGRGTTFTVRLPSLASVRASRRGAAVA